MAAQAASDDGLTIQAIQSQLQTFQAQAEAERLNNEHTYQALEQRFDAMAAELSQAKAERNEQVKVADQANAELATAKADLHQLEVKLVGLQAEQEKLQVSNRELHCSKRDLLHLNNQKEDQLAQKNATIKSYLEQNVRLAEERSEMEGRVSEAERSQRAAETAQRRLELERQSLKQHNDWLDAELSSKADQLLTQRKEASDQTMSLRKQLADLESKAQAFERKSADLTKKCESMEEKLEKNQKLVVDLKSDLSQQKEHYEEELSTANRLTQLFKEKSEDREKKAAELEGAVRAMKERYEEAASAAQEALEAAEEARAAAESEAREARAQMKRMTEAASMGTTLPSPAPSTDGASLPATPVQGGGVTALPYATPEVAKQPQLELDGLTMTSLYTKYAETSDALRIEMAERRRLGKYLQEILQELEAKAPIIQEQRAEYERVAKECVQLQARLDEELVERRHYEAQVKQLHREQRRHDALVSDLNRQVVRLLQEVESARGGAGTPGKPRGKVGAGGVVDASDVISSHLVEFGDVAELQAQNQRLLAVTRKLGEDREQEQAELKKNFEEQLQQHASKAMAQLEELKSQRKQREEFIETIVRQRDMYKAMLQTATVGGSPAGGPSPRTGGAQSICVEMVDTEDKSAPDYQAMLKDLQKEMERAKEEAMENARLLTQQLDQYRSEAAEARHARNLADAESEFQRERYNRLMETADWQRAELARTVAQKEKLADDLLQQQSAHRDAAMAKERAQDEARQHERTIAGLQAEKAMITETEHRTAQEVKALAEERTRLSGLLEALKATADMRQAEHRSELERAVAEKSRLEKDWALDHAELESERQRTRDVEAAAKEEVAAERRKLEESQKMFAQATEARAAAEKKVELLESRNASLQACAAKAEEQLALALSSRTIESGTADGTDAGLTVQREKELLAVAMEAKEELSIAQEAAAAAAAHAAHYKSIAEKNEECLKDMHAAHDKFKAEAQAAAAKSDAELAQMSKDLGDAREELARAQAKLASLADLEAKVSSIDLAEVEQTKTDLAARTQEVANAKLQISALQTDVQQYITQWRGAKRSYEEELLKHAEDIRKMQDLECAAEAAAGKQRLAETKVADAEAKLRSSEVAWEAERARLANEKHAVDRHSADIVEQNRLLHAQLEAFAKKEHADVTSPAKSLAGAGADADVEEEGGASSLAEVVAFLRREKETAECRLLLKEQEVCRLQRTADLARRESDSARAQLAVETERARAAVRAEGEQAQLLEQIQQLNLLRESNATLRKELEHYQATVAALTAQRDDVSNQLEPLRKELGTLRASQTSHSQQVASLQEEAARWEKRTQQLLEKYGQVDLAEHKRVQMLAEAAEAARAAAEAQKVEVLAECEKVRADYAKVERNFKAAKAQIEQVFNPEKLHHSEWKSRRAEERKKIEDLEKREQDLVAALAAAKAATEAAPTQEAQAAGAAELQKYKDLVKKINEDKAKLVQEKVNAEKELKDLQAANQVHTGNTAEADNALREQLRTLMDKHERMLQDNMKSQQTLQARALALAQKVKDAKVSSDQKEATIAELTRKLAESTTQAMGAGALSGNCGIAADELKDGKPAAGRETPGTVTQAANPTSLLSPLATPFVHLPKSPVEPAAGSASSLPVDAVANMRAKALAAQRMPVAQQHRQQQQRQQRQEPALSEAPSAAPKRALEVSSAQPPAKRMELTPPTVALEAAADEPIQLEDAEPKEKHASTAAETEPDNIEPGQHTQSIATEQSNVPFEEPEEEPANSEFAHPTVEPGPETVISDEGVVAAALEVSPSKPSQSAAAMKPGGRVIKLGGAPPTVEGPASSQASPAVVARSSPTQTPKPSPKPRAVGGKAQLGVRAGGVGAASAATKTARAAAVSAAAAASEEALQPGNPSGRIASPKFHGRGAGVGGRGRGRGGVLKKKKVFGRGAGTSEKASEDAAVTGDAASSKTYDETEGA